MYRHLTVEERQNNADGYVRFREVELGMDERVVQEDCKPCLRCDLEWLQEMGLALEPVPGREAAEMEEA